MTRIVAVWDENDKIERVVKDGWKTSDVDREEEIRQAGGKMRDRAREVWGFIII